MNYNNIGSNGKNFRPSAAAVPETPLPRQSSIYSLTFEEFQSTMGLPGKDFGSMNMDELLKNIWTAEESMAIAPASMVADEGGGAAGVGPGLQRQGSLTLPRTVSQKTVDEVWRNLAVEQASGGQGFQQQRQPTLGEITLEEFLLRAGVVREDFNQLAPRSMVNNNNNNVVNNNSSVIYGELPNSSNSAGLTLGFLQMNGNNGTILPNSIPNNSAANLGLTSTSARPYAAPLPLGNPADLASPQGMRGAGIMGIGDPAMNNGLNPGVVGLGGPGATVAAVGSPRNHLSSDGLGKGNRDLSSLSPVPYMFSGGLKGRKRSGTVERVVERRQKRMIKNRESAARSRARKQAYTMELEAEVAKLKEQNEELQKKQEETIEMQKNQVLEMINQQCGAKKRSLRRAHTGPW